LRTTGSKQLNFRLFVVHPLVVQYIGLSIPSPGDLIVGATPKALAVPGTAGPLLPECSNPVIEPYPAAQAIRDRAFSIPIARKFKLSQAAEAQRVSEQGSVDGKILLVP
jgi:hypothetical protein